MRYLIISVFVAILSAFRLPLKTIHSKISVLSDTTVAALKNHRDSLANNVDSFARQFVDYAKTFIGIKYAWGSTNPKVGLDCSGFVNCVSNHFGISVPRTSAEFTNMGQEVNTKEAKVGDIILFTGTNAKKRKVGHMGIVTENADGHLNFIQSSSGHKKGVHISELKGYYKTRLVKIIRIFPVSSNRIMN